MRVSVLDARRRQRTICADNFYEEFLESLGKADPEESVPAPGDRAATRRRMTCAEVDVIVEATRKRLARAEALAAGVEHPAAGAIRRAREALEGAEREPCS